MTKSPRVSIIIATFNSQAYLQRAIDSIVAQDYQYKQLILIDGASTDRTLEIISKNDPKIDAWISGPDQGIYEAFNKGVKKATGDWIYILGSDDYLWRSDVLTRMAPSLQSPPQSSRIVYGNVALVSKNGDILLEMGEPWEQARRHFIDRMTLPHQGVFHHRSLFESNGFFNESFRFAGDYEFLLRELKTADAFYVPGIIIAGYQYGGGSSVPQNALKVWLEFRKAQILNGLKWPSCYWIGRYLLTWLRMLVWRFLGEKNAARFDDWLRGLVGLPQFRTRV